MARVEEALKAKEPPVMEPPAKKPRGMSKELASLKANGSQQPLPLARGNDAARMHARRGR
jgi:hypothetical protein